MSDDKSIEIWLRMYEEQVRHARHHEVLRTQSTNIIVAISAALLALCGTKAVEVGESSIGLFIALINIYGLLMSLKHYERSRLHVGVGAEYRNRLSDFTAAHGDALNDARELGYAKHTKIFRISGLRAYIFWSGLHGLLIVFGIAIAVRAY